MNIAPISLTITRNPDGSVSVEGNALADRLVAYGLLGAARDVVYELHAKQSPIVTLPPGSTLASHSRSATGGA